MGLSHSQMPVVSKGWTKTSAYFKLECGVVNIGLGQGTALEIFNESIIGFSKIK